MQLSNRKQLAIQLESVEGTPEGGEVAGDVVEAQNLTWSPNIETIPRNSADLSGSPRARRAGLLRGTVTFEMECAGTAAGAAPEWDLPLRASGYRAIGDTSGTPFGRLLYATASATWTTGTQLDHGTTVTFNISGATGKVIGTYVPGVTRIWVEELTGTAVDTDTSITASGIDITISDVQAGARGYSRVDKSTWYFSGTAVGTVSAGDILTGATSGAKVYVTEVPGTFSTDGDLIGVVCPGTGTPQAGENLDINASNSLDSIAAPVQLDIPSLTLSFYEDGRRIRFSGCRGNSRLIVPTGKPARFEFTMEGAFDSNPRDDIGFPTAAGTSLDPPLFRNASFEIDQAGVTPLISEISFDTNNQIGPVTDPTATSGLRSTIVASREMSGRMDPNSTVEGAYDWVQNAVDQDQFRLDLSWGSSPSGSATGNAVDVIVPGAQMTVSPTDREGVLSLDAEMFLPRLATAGGDEIAIVLF